jgi:hypothetical protein
LKKKGTAEVIGRLTKNSDEREGSNDLAYMDSFRGAAARNSIFSRIIK